MTQVTDDTFQQEVLSSDLPVLVDFYADWCAPCRAASPTIDEIATEFEGKAKVVKMDVDKNDKTPMANQVRGIPNFIVFKGGQRVAQFVGWSDKTAAEIRAALTVATASN